MDLRGNERTTLGSSSSLHVRTHFGEKSVEIGLREKIRHTCITFDVSNEKNENRKPRVEFEKIANSQSIVDAQVLIDTSCLML